MKGYQREPQISQIWSRLRACSRTQDAPGKLGSLDNGFAGRALARVLFTVLCFLFSGAPPAPLVLDEGEEAVLVEVEEALVLKQTA